MCYYVIATLISGIMFLAAVTCPVVLSCFYNKNCDNCILNIFLTAVIFSALFFAISLIAMFRELSRLHARASTKRVDDLEKRIKDLEKKLNN
jgi:membrane-anchored glycerophosphoryl diester phosphodiesterase (GDPDase)